MLHNQKEPHEQEAELLVRTLESTSEETRTQFFQLLARKRDWMEDLLDSATVEQRRSESSRPMDDILKEVNDL